MKILQVNKFYYPRGGADKYFLWLTDALKATGQEVAVFSMAHPKNLPTPWSRYFVSQISFNEGGLKDKLKIPGRVFYSPATKKKFARLVKDFKPDIIHIHNIYHHLSPSLLSVAGRYQIPVVMHLHDYKLISPDYNLLDKNLIQSTTERARPKKYYQYLFSRAVKNSRWATALAVLEMYFHHKILKIYQKNISVLIAPSRFMKETVMAAGWPAEKIKVIYNPYSPDLMDNRENFNKNESDKDTEPIIIKNELKNTQNNSANYLLYFGRLKKEKGLEILIKAAALTQTPVKIAGAGPDEEYFKTLAGELKAPVEFLGFKNAVELKPVIEKAQAIVIPSIWPENMPLSLLETMNLGKIAIVSRIGGLPEIVKDGENGFLFEPGNVEDLARQIKRLAEIDRVALSQKARTTAAEFTPEKNLKAMLEVYKGLTTNAIK